MFSYAYVPLLIHTSLFLKLKGNDSQSFNSFFFFNSRKQGITDHFLMALKSKDSPDKCMNKLLQIISVFTFLRSLFGSVSWHGALALQGGNS